MEQPINNDTYITFDVKKGDTKQPEHLLVSDDGGLVYALGRLGVKGQYANSEARRNLLSCLKRQLPSASFQVTDQHMFASMTKWWIFFKEIFYRDGHPRPLARKDWEGLYQILKSDGYNMKAFDEYMEVNNAPSS